MVHSTCAATQFARVAGPLRATHAARAAGSPNHLISKEQQLLRHLDAQRSGGFGVDDELEPRRLLATTLKRWHRQTMAGLAVPHPKLVGAFRGEPGLEGEPAYIGAREGAQAETVPAEVDAFVVRLQSVLTRLDKMLLPGKELDRDGLQAVIELAAWAHSEWVRIHPFSNGNGRTARVLTNAILMRYGQPPVLQLRPRPPSPYGHAGALGMDGDSRPMETLLRRLLKDYPPPD